MLSMVTGLPVLLYVIWNLLSYRMTHKAEKAHSRLVAFYWTSSTRGIEGRTLHATRKAKLPQQ